MPVPQRLQIVLLRLYAVTRGGLGKPRPGPGIRGLLRRCQCHSQPVALQAPPSRPWVTGSPPSLRPVFRGSSTERLGGERERERECERVRESRERERERERDSERDGQHLFLILVCHAERSAALQVTRAPGRTTERGTCCGSASAASGWRRRCSRVSTPCQEPRLGLRIRSVYVSVCLSTYGAPWGLWPGT